MTQVFANISSLADFLVAEKNLSKTETTDNASATGFEDFLAGQIAAADLPVENQNSSDFGIEEGQTELEGVNNPTLPIWDFSGLIKLPLQQLTNLNERAIGEAIGTANLIPSESIMPVQIKISQLKQLVSQQNIPLSLTLNQAELAKIVDENGLKEIADFSPNLADSRSIKSQSEFDAAENAPPARPQSEMIEYLTDTESVSLKNNLQPTPIEKNIQLTIDAGKLVNSQGPVISATASTENSIGRDIQVKVSELLNLFKQNPDKAVVQIKSIPTKEGATQELPRSALTPENPIIEKSFLVNLNAFVSGVDSEPVAVLQKLTLIKTDAAKTTNPISDNAVKSALADISENKISSTPALSEAVKEIVETERPINRKIENQQTGKVENPQQRLSAARYSDQEIQPLQSDKPAENSVANIYGKGYDFRQPANQFTFENRSIAQREPTNLLFEHSKILNQIQSQLQSVNGNTLLTIQLKPESLGKVKVELKTEGDKLNATFKVDNPDVKRVLDAELPNLKDDWKIDNFRVETNPRNANQGFGGANNHNQTKMSDGRSSGSAFRTSQPENGADNRNQNAPDRKLSSPNGRIDLFA